MIDDIVTLLRKYQPYSKLHGQAADEIERLREQVKALVHEWELSERGEHKEVRGE